ncbi:MAG TPA: twin-arginine translocase TatA/TatE family subunit [Acidimicrobiales bacterium]|jgi:sec-independent protein translocase protein TatA|nr:twin-arginine translocase TatA/TatE family subunit [Acidimicrobiales bacterium]
MVVANIAGLPDIGIVVLLVVILFGGSQLPKIARNIGMAGKEFRKAHDEASKDDSAPAPPTGSPVAVPPPAAVAASTADDSVTLSKAELDALLAEREARARGQATS